MSRKALAAGAVVLLLGGAGATWYIAQRQDTTTVAEAATLATTKVQQQDVVTYQETTATLGYTQSVTVSSPVAGTVTSIVASGDSVKAGTVVATVDGTPVVAMIGDVPGYRDLSTSSGDGVDVRQLETNLVTLGFDPDGAITIDENFDSATKAAVNRWKASLGITEDGKVAQGLVAYVPGELQVDSVSSQVGSGVASGGALLTARMTKRLMPISAAAGSVVSSFAKAGTPVITGTVLFRRDGLPVGAVEGDQSAIAVLSRDLSVGVDAGADVRPLEQMLKANGFDASGLMTVDDTFDVATAVAVQQWWQSVDASIVADPDTLIVPAGSYVVVPAGLQSGAATVEPGTTLAGDSVVLQLTAPAREVSTTAPIGDATFALGAVIDVEFPDGTVSKGKVVSVGNVASTSGNTPGQTPTVPIGIRVTKIPKSVNSFVSIPVTLRVVDQQVKAALVVPTAALLALKEGGYALEVVTAAATDSTAAVTHLIGVTPSLYSNGFVVVTGDELKAGLDVVVPS